MMKKLFGIALCLVFSIMAQAQDVHKEIAAHREWSASNYLAYPGPKDTAYTRPPKGYEPFYISHYGRHGSRYLIGKDAYDRPYKVLMRADSLGKLTYIGKGTLEKIAKLREEARGRDGELTLLGSQQHRQIAQRMYDHFPKVFQGIQNVDANSTVVIRCILSMENALQQLVINNPRLNVRHDASEHDMWYMNFDDKVLGKERMPEKAKKEFDKFCDRHANYSRVMERLFKDTAYVEHAINAKQLNQDLFKLASNVQSTELRHELSFYDLFDDEEIYDNWVQNNAWWYICFGPSPLSGGKQPYTQRNLLRRIIQQADSCIRYPHPGATLRFGHEVNVLPLACLLELNNCGKQIEDLEKLPEEGWCNYRIFPMACNIQIIFYRRSVEDNEVLVKVLLNEEEAKLPLPGGKAPYYLWSDFKKYYLKKLDSFHP